MDSTLTRLDRSVDFLVNKKDLHECRVAEAAPVELEPGQALLAVDAFALTANNITYAVLGDMMSYWNFFPAEEGWGRVPVWGFADVVESTHDSLEEGTRIYGYLPPSSQLVVKPERVDPRGFMEGSEHRSQLPATYNSYVRTDADPGYAEGYEAQQMLLRPLFFTSFLIDDFLDHAESFGASAVIFSSASSKTAIGTAFLLSRRQGVEVIGLTSPGNAEFVEGLGIYDRVVPYEAVGSLDEQPSVYVDMAGDGDLRKAVHRHYGDQLAHSAIVGATHWDAMALDAGELPGPAPTVFFAPDRVAKRSKEWGREELERRLGAAWLPFVEWTSGWLEVSHGSGPEDVERVYRELLDGRSRPAAGHILSL